MAKNLPVVPTYKKRVLLKAGSRPSGPRPATARRPVWYPTFFELIALKGAYRFSKPLKKEKQKKPFSGSLKYGLMKFKFSLPSMTGVLMELDNNEITCNN